MIKNTPSIKNRLAGQAGFTLTEMAIVMGIIGVVIGGIWTAMASMQESKRVSKANEELMQIVQHMKELYKDRPEVSRASMNIKTTNKGGKLIYIQAGIFPADMLQAPIDAASNMAINPWSGTVAIRPVTTKDGYSVSFNGIPQSACIKMIIENAGPTYDSSLVAVDALVKDHYIGDPPVGGYKTRFPITLKDATTICTHSGGLVGDVILAFWYKIGI